MALNMQPFQHFDPDSETATVSQRWKNWKSRFENFWWQIISQITRESELYYFTTLKKECAIFLRPWKTQVNQCSYREINRIFQSAKEHRTSNSDV